VAHPGVTTTNQQTTGPSGVWKFVYKRLVPLMVGPTENGAIPLISSAAGVEADQRSLWDLSEQVVAHKFL